MRILFINTTYKSGSTGKIVYQLEQEELKQRNEAFVAFGRNCNIEDHRHYRIGNKFEMLFHLLKTRLFDGHGLGSKRGTYQLIRWIDSINPDIIHLHNIHGYYLNYPILFKYLISRKIKVRWTLHDCWAFTGHCSHYDFIQCNKWQTECFECQQKREYPKSLFLDNSQKNYIIKKKLFSRLYQCEISIPSKWLKNEVEKSFFKMYPTILRYNTIDNKVFNGKRGDFRERYQLQDKFLILGVASVWTERKGLKCFFELVTRLRANQKIVLVGLSKKQMRILPQNIIGIERTENITQLAEIYAESDVFFNPTLEDNYPTTNIEAKSSGIPIITFDSGGSKETVEDYEKGYVVKKGDLKEVVAIIINLERSKSNL
ncbi:MAG: glycosyltransferase [Fusobacteria bacterium]|nr:glycosyltransferase [Fusobacteriota bacterium]